MRTVTIRRTETLTVAGRTRTRALCAVGVLTPEGTFRLTACAGCIRSGTDPGHTGKTKRAA